MMPKPDPKILVISCDGTLDSPHSRRTHIQTIHGRLLGPHEIFTCVPYDENKKQGWEINQYYTNYKENTFMMSYYDVGQGEAEAHADESAKGPIRFGIQLENKFKEIGAAAAGIGILDNVAQAYLFLVRFYNPGDKIFCFGFSRGAYTLLILEQVINQIGLINKQAIINDRYYHSNLKQAIADGFACCESNIPPEKNIRAIQFAQKYSYKNKDFIDRNEVNRKDFALNKDYLKHLNSVYKKHIIHFMGLIDNVRGLILEHLPDVHHISNVCKHTREALSIDEHREQFRPVLLRPNIECDNIKCWFAGVHSDLGGAYRDEAIDKMDESGLSHCSLRWVVEEAMQCGLLIQKIILDKHFPRLPLNKQHNSLADPVPYTVGVYWSHFPGRFERTLMTMPFESIHPSVYERYLQEVYMQQENGKWIKRIYCPANLKKAIDDLLGAETHAQKDLLLFNRKFGYPIPNAFNPAEQKKQKENSLGITVRENYI